MRTCVALILFGLVGVTGCQTVTKPLSGSDALDPDSAQPVNQTSVVETKIEKYKGLAKEFPQEPKYQERLARLYWAKREHRPALKHLSYARKLDPDNPKYDFIEGRIHLAISNYSAAETSYLRMVRNSPKEQSAGPWVELGWLYLAMENRLTDAEHAFRKAVEIDPKIADAYFYLAQVCLQRRDEKQAIENFELYLRHGGGSYQDLVLFELKRLQPKLSKK